MSITARLRVLHGSDEPLQELVTLRAGPLTAVLDGVDLRYVRLGDIELVRRIYVAVRDRNWNTIPGVASDVEVDQRDDSFDVRFEVRHFSHDTDFSWQGAMTGSAEGRVSFRMDGRGERAMLYNRIGFCVLHPWREAAGQRFRGQTPDGPVEGELPLLVGPQSFVDGVYVPLLPSVSRLELELAPGGSAVFEFEGDLFETEDQRNWTDASFKTYCTPLALGFPHELAEGERTAQAVTVSALGATEPLPLESGSSPLLSVGGGRGARMPDIGLALPAGAPTLSDDEAGLLRALAPAHLRCEVHAGQADWPAGLAHAARYTGSLPARLELALFVDAAAVLGIYWLQAASVKLLNPDHLNQIWAYRIPSLIGATVAVVMTAAIGALLFGPMAGFLAAMMMAGCLILNTEARLAKTDAALLGSIMVAQYGLARAYINYGVAKLGKLVSFAFWTALGIGILLKGPIILLIVLTTMLWLRVSQKQIKWFADLKPLIGVPYLLLLIAPWFAAIMMQSHGEFLQQSAGHDLLGKLWQDQGRGFIPPGGYLVAFPFTFFPFAVFALLAIPDSWRNRDEPAVWFCLGWILPSWIVFELALAKLPHYTMPLYPPIAMLAAKALLDGYPTLMAGKLRWLKIAAIGIWLAAGIGIVLVTILAPYKLEGTWNKGQIAAGLLMLIAQSACLPYLFGKKESSAVIIAAGSLVFITSIFSTLLPRMPNIWPSAEIMRTAENIKPCPDPVQLISNYNEPSLVFLAGTSTILENDGAVIGADLRQDTCRIAVVKDDQRDAFLKSFSASSVQPLEAGAIHRPDISKSHEISLYLMSKGK